MIFKLKFPIRRLDSKRSNALTHRIAGLIFGAILIRRASQ